MERENLTDAKEWLSYAENDLGVAEHLFKTYYPKPLSIIGFHCQQAAEKAVKALIVLHGSQGGIPKKHDVFLLLNQIKNMVAIDTKFYDYADILAPYGIAVRFIVDNLNYQFKCLSPIVAMKLGSDERMIYRKV